MALKGILKNTEAGPSRPKAKASARIAVSKADAPGVKASATKAAKGKAKAKAKSVQVSAPEREPDSSEDNDFDDEGDDEPDTEDEIERAQAEAESGAPKLPKKKRGTSAADFGARLTDLLSEPTRKRKGREGDDDEGKTKRTKKAAAPAPAPILALSAKPLPPSQAEEKLERRAARALKAERLERLDRARVRNVLEGWTPADGANMGSQEFERALRKTAQRGVIKLFNAILVASKNAEAAATTLSQKAGLRPEAAASRKEKDNVLGRGGHETLTKESFLDLVRRGGK